MTKKGVFYTLTLSLLAIALVSLAFLSFTFSQSSQSQYIELSSAFSVYDMHTSISKVMSDAFSHKNTTFVRTTRESIVIQESLPVDFDALDAQLTSLKNKIERDFRNVNITIGEHALYFLPMNLSLSHIADNHFVLSLHPNVTGYNITLRYSGSVSSCSENSDAGSIHVELYVIAGGSNCTFNQNVGEFQLTVNGQQTTLEIDDDNLELQSNSSVKTSISVSVVPQSQYIDVEMPMTVSVREPVFGFEKNAFVQLMRRE